MVGNHRVPGRQLTSQEAQNLLNNKSTRVATAEGFTVPKYAFEQADFDEIKDAAKHSRLTTSRFRLRCFVFNGVTEVFISPRLDKTPHEHVPCGRFPVTKVLTSARL